MFLKLLGTVVLATSLLFVVGSNDGPTTTQEATKVDLKDVKCFLMPTKNAKEANSADYKEGKVYFCCGNCLKKFSADKDKYATKANHQLALTGQYVQATCPISGEAVDAAQTLDVGGVKVAFCCEKCKGKVEKAETADAKAEMVFAKDTFDKNFAKKGAKGSETAATCPISGGKVDEKVFVEFNGGKVYFCCKDCVEKFSADDATQVAKANHQLVVTQQFVQKGCPMSGGKVNQEQFVSVTGAKVGFCCGNCKKKADGAESDDARIAMLFGKDAFAKSFEKKN